MHPLLHTPLLRLALVAAVTLVSLLGATATAAAQQYHGAQLHALWGGVSVAEYERELDLLAEAGADSVRIDLGWSSIESDGKGRYNEWYVNRVDTFMEHARARGLKVIVALVNSPCWASSAPETDKAGCAGSWWDRGVQVWTPTNPSDYADAAAWVARRWQADLGAIEIWNEPNETAYYRAADPARDYARLVKASYGPIKAAAPGVPVVAGAVAHSDRPFLERLYDHGIAGNYDGLSIHPYNEWRDPDDPWQPQWKAYSFLSGVEWVRELMVQKGDADKGLWLTEFGFSTCGDADKVCVSAEEQAQYTRDSFKIAAGWDFVRAAMVYNLRNIDDNPNSRLGQYGLVNRDFSRKPAYEALKQAFSAYYGPNASAPTGPDRTPGGSPQPAPAAGPGRGTQVAGGFVSVGAGGSVLVTTRRGITRVKLTCRAQAGRRCRGRLRLRTARSRLLRASRTRALGQRSFSIRPGTTTVRIRLNSRARRLVAARGRIRVAAVVVAKRGSSRAKTPKRTFVLARA